MGVGGVVILLLADELTIYVDRWSPLNADDVVAEAEVEGDFLGDGFALHVLAEFLEVTLAFARGDEIIFEKGRHVGGSHTEPFALIAEEEVFILGPVALDAGGVGGGGGNDAIFMIGHDVAAEDEGDFAIVLFVNLI